jgi:hypothetical protein
MALLGALAGAAALMRWQDAIFVLVPLVEVLAWRSPVRTRLAGLAVAGLCAAAVFSPQMAVWHALYGQPLAIPQGPSFMQWSSPHLVDVLFSRNHGLFTWAPMLVTSVAGLVVMRRRLGSAWPALVVVVLVSWYVNAAVADWWAGEAFGARRFLSLFPLFVLGTALWLEADGKPAGVRTRRAVLAVCLTAVNLLLLLQYQLFMKGLGDIAPYPYEWFDMWVARFVVPVRLVEWWLH